MRSIRAIFVKVVEENPEWSDYVCFSEAVAHRKFSKDRISRAFNKFVPREDCPESRRGVLRYLSKLSLTEGQHYVTKPENRLLVGGVRSNVYNTWRREVFERDNKKCRICGKNFPLVVHHIVEFVKSPALRTDVNNGITLCQDCHKVVHHKSLPKPEIYTAENLQKLALKSPTNDFYTGIGCKPISAKEVREQVQKLRKLARE